MVFHEVAMTPEQRGHIQSTFLREAFHYHITLLQKKLITYVLGSFYLLTLVIFLFITVLVVKKDTLLHKENVILRGIFKGLGQIFTLINYILFIPSLVIFAETLRCVKSGEETQVGVFYTCYNQQHFSILMFSIASAIAASVIVFYTNFFINSQFPTSKLPHATWDGKPLFIKSIFKIGYIYHYDLIDIRYVDFLRCIVLFVLFYSLRLRFNYPKLFNRSINIFLLSTESFILCLTSFVTLQDLISEQIRVEHFPIIALCIFLTTLIINSRQTNNNNRLLARDNVRLNDFKNETEMTLYVSILLQELSKLKNLEKGQEYSSNPHVFTIISRHMEHCRNDECICKKYEPEYDKKFSSIGSRRLTMRQSSSFSSVDYLFKKKIPIKISYENKCSIYMQEIADCIDRFLVVYPKSVDLKLLKSFFHHGFSSSSYKALFVQLENCHLCNSFRGKISIYHLKTRIQEEMTQSEASPFSIDITTCLQFEAKRITFEQTIVDLCMICETFWNELSQDNQEYNLNKIHGLILEISHVIIQIKDIFNQLCSHNPQNIAVIQHYALVYRYILRDEFRFNDIINNLNQLKKTNKLESTRELLPKFFDSDNYAMLLVSGDVKELGRIVKANRGVEHIFGYMPNELHGSKINKIMPKLFSNMHDEAVSNFLKRGHSTFIDKNQFLLIENKLRFIQMTLGYVKVMVNLKLGLMFVSFFKLPQKVPSNCEGGFLKSKDAHYILCDGKGYIHSMSNNCMKNLGIPPTIISRTKNANDASCLVNIEQFSPNILGDLYEFDLPKGINFTFDTSWFKNDKYLQKEFHELTGRMRKYNIFVSLKKYEFRNNPNRIQEALVFTIEIISFQLSEAPITIPIDKTDDASYSQYTGTTVSSANSDELRTTKFKEFKAQVQEVKTPTKISVLKKITITFFILLLGIFSLNYALCAVQNNRYVSRIEVLDLLYQLSEKVPSTSRYIRNVMNIVNGLETNSNEIIPDRFSYYMKRIDENSETFRNIQQQIFTQYSKDLSFDVVNVYLKDLQTDLTIKNISSTIQSALNIFSSKALKFSTYKWTDLQGVIIPYISFDFNLDNAQGVTQIQQDLYYILQNGHQAVPQGILDLSAATQKKIEQQSQTFNTVSLLIALVSIVVNFSIIPFVYPLLVHYERLAFFILHAFNRLTKKFIENEVKCCNELLNYIGKKQGSGQADKQSGTMMRKPEARKENKQLMKVNPMIPRIVIEQEKRKSFSKRKRKSVMKEKNDEEEKELMVKAGRITQGIDADDLSGIDEDLDEEDDHIIKKHVQSRRKHSKVIKVEEFKEGTQSNQDVNTQGTHSHLFNYNTSAASIDESTIRTSMDINSSTNKSSKEQSDSESSQSNYTHYTNLSQWKAIKIGDYGNQVKSNASINYDITWAKSSELQGEYIDPKAELSEEEKELKKQIRARRQKIKDVMKKKKICKVFLLILLAILISIYLGVNTLYTRLVFQYENDLQQDINIIDDRILCFPGSLEELKEMIARNESDIDISKVDLQDNLQIERASLIQCYKYQSNFYAMVLGEQQGLSNSLLAIQYQQIEQQFQRGALCKTVFQDQLQDTSRFQQCSASYNGLMNLGLNEVLNYILRQEEKTIIDFKTSERQRSQIIEILKNSSITGVESVKDYFIDDVLKIQRNMMIDQIKAYAKKLFRIFDILFSVFVTICSILVIFGIFYLIRRMKKLIIQIYHIVLLIPYGERTKRELNELLKIRL